jgi:hypothetical protein
MTPHLLKLGKQKATYNGGPWVQYDQYKKALKKGPFHLSYFITLTVIFR